MQRPSSIGPLHVLAAVVVFVSPALWEFFRGTALTGITAADFWWHLQTGLEILRTHALPHTGWFSQSAAQPWIASSWLYDVRIAGWYQLLGLRFLPVLALVAKFFLAVLMFLLAGGLRGRFWTALALSIVAQYLLWQMPPLPVFCSVLALAIELALLFDFRRNRQVRSLYFLPALFVAWANLDPRFVYGILVLLLFAAVCTVEGSAVPWIASRRTDVQITRVAVLTGVTLIATCITPYGWSGYGVFWANVTSAANTYFPDYQSPRFRSPQDYVLLLLSMAAFLALGMRRSRDLFQISLLVLCTVAAFHAQRDGWLLALAAVAVIGNPVAEEAPSGERRDTSSESRAAFLLATGVSVVLLLAILAVRMPARDAVLAKLSEHYPVAAADYIRANQLPTPLFNPYSWGGFLTWYLPEYPVAIDGRTELYGPDFNIQYAKAMNFEMHYSTFPPLNGAATILLDKSSTMASALPKVRGFKTVYSDNVAVVLVRDQDQP